MAQSRPGYKVKFQKVSVEEAQELYVAQLKEYEALREKFEKEPEPCSERDAVIQAAVAKEAAKYWSPAGKYRVVIDGQEFEVELMEGDRGAPIEQTGERRYERLQSGHAPAGDRERIRTGEITVPRPACAPATPRQIW